MRRSMIAVSLTGLTAVAAVTFGLYWLKLHPRPLSQEALHAKLSQPLPPPEGPLAVYHLGHSLVGREMPKMLAQIAGHDHASQLGWGSALKAHWDGTLNGFETENAHPNFRPAAEAIDSGAYPVLVMTEMVELKDAIRHFKSPHYLRLWAKRARAARPDIRLYLYETWHNREDPQHWEQRIRDDLPKLWEGVLLAGAMADPATGPIYVIPGGQVMAAAARAIDAGEVPHLQEASTLFARHPDGQPDTIHFSGIGAYLMALTHYAVIYQKDPSTVAHDLPPELSEATAHALQKITWQVVRQSPHTGFSKTDHSHAPKG